MSKSPKKKKYKFDVGQRVYYIDDDWYRKSFDDPDTDTHEWVSSGIVERVFTEDEINVSDLVITPIYYNVRDADSVIHYYYEECALFSTPEEAKAFLIERVSRDLKALSINLRALKDEQEISLMSS